MYIYYIYNIYITYIICCIFLITIKKKREIRVGKKQMTNKVVNEN